MEPNSSRPADQTPDTPETPNTPLTPVQPETAPSEQTAVSQPDAQPTTETVSEPTSQPTPVAEPATSSAAPAGADPGHGLGIASLVLSIIGVHLVGLILGIIALNKSKKAGYKNGLALAGVIIGAVGLVIATILFVFLIGLAAQLGGVCADLGSGLHEVKGVTYTCS